MSTQEDDTIEKMDEFRIILNNLELEFTQYFPGPGKGTVIKPEDKIRNHFYVKYDNEQKKVIPVVVKNIYPDLIQSCRELFDQHF